MKLFSIISNLCLGTSIAALVVDYGLSMYWPVLLALPAMLLFWLWTKRGSVFWRASALLCVYLGLAVTAVLLNRPLVPLTIGCVAALAWWDLEHFESTQPNRIGTELSGSPQKYRLQSLALTAVIGLFLAGTRLWLRIQLPFGMIALLTILATGCLVSAGGIFHRAESERG